MQKFLWADHFLQDLRYGFRILAKTPGFTLLAVVSLALGIMATTAMYSVIHGVVLNPFPYRDVMAAEIAVSQLDPVSFAAVSLLLFAVGLAACFWPARRAARMDPMRALRHE